MCGLRERDFGYLRIHLVHTIDPEARSGIVGSILQFIQSRTQTSHAEFPILNDAFTKPDLQVRIDEKPSSSSTESFEKKESYYGR